MQRAGKTLLAGTSGHIYLLHPPLLDDLGLEAAVRFHVDSFVERTKIKVELDMEANLGRLDRNVEIALFRVVQEALANIDQQAAGQNARIKIGASSSNVLVEEKPRQEWLLCAAGSRPRPAAPRA